LNSTLNIVPYLLNHCKDFRDEKTDLEYMVEELVVELDTDCTFRILFTPKYDCEVAGEGIEYSWGAGKERMCQNDAFQEC
jgi:hypothetical protein